MADEPIFDAEYDEHSATRAGIPIEKVAQEQDADAGLHQDPRDSVRVYDTGRPRRITREWSISSG